MLCTLGVNINSHQHFTFQMLTLCCTFIEEDFQSFCFCKIKHLRTQGWQRILDDSLVPSSIVHLTQMLTVEDPQISPSCTPQANVTLTALLNTMQELHLEHATGHMEHTSRPPQMFFVLVEIWILTRFNTWMTSGKVIL